MCSVYVPHHTTRRTPDLQTLSTFPGISSAITSVHLVDNSLKMQEIQRQKLEPRMKGRLFWNDWIDDVPKSEVGVGRS
jgi:SAM-dependent MidA family methyltransferase